MGSAPMSRIEPRIWRYSLVALPAMAALLIVLLIGRPSVVPAAVLAVLVVVITLLAIRAVIRGDRHDEHTLMSLLEAVRQGQYSVRARLPSSARGTPSVLGQINALAIQLQRQHAAEQEASSLLRKTLAALDAGVFLFDHRQALKLVNPAGAEVLASSGSRLLGLTVQQLGLQALMDCPSGAVQSHEFERRSGRWQVTHATLRSAGLPAQLLVIQLVEPILRREQANTFSQLLRVISHEINNSLAPISSMAVSARDLLPSDGVAMDEEHIADIRESLDVISRRSESLQRFIGQYAELARMPRPQLEAVSLAALAATSLAIFPKENVTVESDDLIVLIDRAQMEQVLINLVRNGLESPGSAQVTVRWRHVHGRVVIEVADDGSGLPATSNLFVPFFTTKKGGSGIGLALSRHIIDAHGGTLVLEDRVDGPGAVARIELNTPGGEHGPATRSA